MKRISLAILFWLIFIPAALFARPTTWQALSSRIPGGLDERRLRHLEQGYTVEEVEPNLLKMTYKETGMVKYVDIADHSFDFDNPPADVQVVDLINADTMIYNWKYIRKNMFPIGSLIGYPMITGDFNNNGKINLAGSYKIVQDYEIADCAIAEVQQDSTFAIKKIYTDSVTMALASTDVDNDNLQEINLRRHQNFDNYEAAHPDSFPGLFKFTYRMWENSNRIGSETFIDLDDDGNLDVLYVGDDFQPPCCQKIFVAEYNPQANQFEKIFSHRPQPDWRVSGFSVGDFDEDGFREFSTGSVFGDVYVFENTGNDSYQQVFYDTVSTPNAYLTGVTNDIDSNGKIELFLGGSSFYNGIPASRVYWFEAEGNDNYVKQRSFFLLGTDVLGNTELFIHDVNSDGMEDLVFAFSFTIAILIWNQSAAEFELHYLDHWEKYNQEIESANMVDVFNSGKPDLFINVEDIVAIPRIRTYFYRPNSISNLRPSNYFPDQLHLSQNYPNPFNSNTTIYFQLPQRNRITLAIYDITGREVLRLIDNRLYAPGEHEIKWNSLNKFGKEVSSGIYLYELNSGSYREVRKMLLVK